MTAAAAALAAVAVLGISTVRAVAGLEPFATWYYPLAWYSTLVLLDAAVASRDGRFFLLGRAAFLASALAWSIPFWLVFELLNLRLENWYYVFLPREPLARWAGIALSFATVIPAVLVSERLLESLGVAREAKVRAFRITPGLAKVFPALGIVLLALPVASPRVFFPLVWGGVLLIVDPWVRARDPARSLLGDLERGRPGRIVRLLAGGLAIGLLWEVFNLAARGKWIYTVPGLEDFKLFEMPALGFLGFPPFALEAFAVWQALVVARLAVPAEGGGRSARIVWSGFRPIPLPALAGTVLAALVFSAAMIAAMHVNTIASVAPAVSDFGAPTSRLAAAGIEDAWALAAAEPMEVAARTGMEEARVRAWIERARLATLRGIGAGGAERLANNGIKTVEDLARADPASLVARLRADGAPTDPARIRVWVRAARDAARRD